jgi:hypothetical protein
MGDPLKFHGLPQRRRAAKGWGIALSAAVPAVTRCAESKYACVLEATKCTRKNERKKAVQIWCCKYACENAAQRGMRKITCNNRSYSVPLPVVLSNRRKPKGLWLASGGESRCVFSIDSEERIGNHLWPTAIPWDRAVTPCGGFTWWIDPFSAIPLRTSPQRRRRCTGQFRVAGKFRADGRCGERGRVSAGPRWSK